MHGRRIYTEEKVKILLLWLQFFFKWIRYMLCHVVPLYQKGEDPHDIVYIRHSDLFLSSRDSPTVFFKGKVVAAASQQVLRTGFSVKQMLDLCWTTLPDFFVQQSIMFEYSHMFVSLSPYTNLSWHSVCKDVMNCECVMKCVMKCEGVMKCVMKCEGVMKWLSMQIFCMLFSYSYLGQCDKVFFLFNSVRFINGLDFLSYVVLSCACLRILFLNLAFCQMDLKMIPVL